VVIGTERDTIHSSRRLPLAALALSALAVAGCGGGSNYKNQDRPASPITITGVVSDKGVSISPAKFGAGPIVLLITNQSRRSQAVSLIPDTSQQAGELGSTGPINPQGTGQVQLDVKQGTYTVKVGAPAIKPATVTVGPPRPSAQNDVLQP